MDKKQMVEFVFKLRKLCECIIFLMSKEMVPEQVLDKMKADFSKEYTIRKQTLQEARRFFEEHKNNQQRGKDILPLKQKIIGFCVVVIREGKPSQPEKVSILELLERELISSKHNSNLFNTLYDLLEKDDENVAIQASKAIDVLIKQINEKSQVTSGAVPLDLKQHYIKLFEFLRDKTRFLLDLNLHVKDHEFKVFRRQPFQENRDKDREKDKKEIVFKNSKSLKFINQVPHLFIHLMAYAELDTKINEEEKKIKSLIKESIENIIQSLKKTPYQEFYEDFNFDFNNELFAVMTKLLQFLFITLRNEKEERGGRETNKSNQNLRKHINEQLEFIKVPEVIKNFIYLLKNCSEDFQLNRYEIVNRLKLLLGSLEKTKLNINDAIGILEELLNEETIYGKKKLLGDYSKNAICTYWIEIVKSPVLLNNIFYQPFLSIRQISTSNLSEDSLEIKNCFDNIKKLLDEVLKTIFDNTIYPSVQEKCIELLTVIMDQLFPEGTEHFNDMNTINSSAVAKKVHENKLEILLKILQAASLKFESIKNIFEEIDLYLTKKLGRKVCKDDLPEPHKMKHMQLNSLELSISDTNNFDSEVIKFFEDYDEKIDSSLLTVIAVPNKFLTIYEEDDELCFNSHPVKTNNFTQYMRQVKTKLIEKCITLSHKLTKTFLTQNLEVYTQAEIQSLKTIYFSLTNKKSLSSEQCSILSTILKNGLRIFEILHNYELHSDEQTNKRGHLKNFMLIFAQVYDPVNFRDIFEPNMEEFFRNLVKYAKYCADYCLQFVLIEPFCSNSSNREIPFNKNIVQLLIYNLILRLESTSDLLDPFHEFYGYKQEYFSLLQKLIRFPFRCLSRYADDSFIRNYFRQIILFLIKKAHTSRFCLDYLHLMRTLFKNILFNCNRDTASPLFSEFYAICSKPTSSSQQTQQGLHSTFVNVNVLDNFMKLYETGIPELADIITELIIMLPLKSKHIIQFAKQGYIVKPLLHCLCLMSDYNYTLRTLKTFEIIISHSNAEEINEFLDGVKEKLIDRLYDMVGDCKINDLKLDKINNDLSPLSLKLLAKLGALSRNRELPIKMREKEQCGREIKLKELELMYRDLKTNKVVKVEMVDSIEYAIQIFHKILDPYYQSIVFITMEMIEQCFELLKEVLPDTLSKMHPLSERIICIFCNILSLSSKYLTISQSILKNLREEVKKIISSLTETIKDELLHYGLNDYCKFFIKSLVKNLSERVLITREDNFIKEISEEPKKFLWELIKSMLSATENTNNSDILYDYVIRLLISQVIMINNPQHIEINNFQSEYNHVLPYRNAALFCLNEIIDSTPPAVLEETKGDILQSVFIVVTTVPDILNLKIMQHPPIIAKKIFDHMLKNEEQFMKELQTEQGERIFANILENLVSYSLEAHKISASFLHKIMNETKLSLPEILYGGMRWDDIYDKSSPATIYQSKFTLENLNLNEKEIKKCPITQLTKNLVKISYNVNDENLKNNPRMLKMLSNAFLTYQLLIEIKYKDKKYHMFSILGKNGTDVEFNEQTAIFDKNFENILKVAQAIIDINSNLEGNFSKIIIEQPQAQQPPATVPPATATQPPPAATQPARNPRDGNRPLQATANLPTAPAPNQAFNINPNTYIDDEEYGLNVEDFDIEIKTWSTLISSILKFLQSVLINDTVFNITKSIQKNKIDKSPISEKRFKIILVMFELIGRVERTIRQTAYESIKELLSREDHPKELTPNDEKLKHLLKPVLISLQLDFKKFTPSFLHMFKKILKLLTQCFNLTLIQKLVDKLREMDKNKENELSITPRLTNQNPPRLPNYSEITCEVKCIANFLGLFKHLAYAFHSQRNARYSSNTLILIFKYVVSICEYFVPKLGKNTVNQYIKKILSKVLNTMCERITGEGVFNEGRERELEFSNFLEIIKMDDSYPLREKLTRDTDYIEKFLTDFLKPDTSELKPSQASQHRKDYFTFLEIILELSRRNNRWLKGMNSLAKQILDQLIHCIENRQKRFELREVQEIGEKNEVLLLAKILLQYIKINPKETDYLFGLMNLFKIRTNFDLQPIKMYLRYELYYNLKPETRRKIFVDYLKMYREQPRDTDKILAIGQHIIYEFVLIEIAKTPEERSILIKDDEVIKVILDTIKNNLSPKLLHSRNSNVYREAIEILQISNLGMSALKDLIEDRDRNEILLTVWGLLRIEDKIIKHYAFVWTSNYIRYFDGLGSSKTLGLYLILIRALENLGHGDYEIGALIRKALNILIPYWDGKPKEVNANGNSWIDLSLRAVHDDANEPTRLVRFWEIVVKNHHIFHKFKEVKFETQMVNSMQWLMVGNNPTSTNPLVKKIASDMSFIYIEWKFKEVKERMNECQNEAEKKKVLESTYNERAAEICLNFFIKVALNNCNNSVDKEDKDIMKRSLYLLKKTLILWPNTKKKFDNIKGVISRQKSSNSQGLESPLRFQYTLLNIINILLSYETDEKLLPQLTFIFKLIELGQISPPRIPGGNPNINSTSNSIFTMNNIYLMNLLCVIVKRLLKVAMTYPAEEESQKLINEIHSCIKDGLDYYVFANNSRSRANMQAGMRQQLTKKIQIEIVISFLKIVFDLDHKLVEAHLNNIKQTTSWQKKMFEKGFGVESNKNANNNRVYEPPSLTEGTFAKMMSKDLEINIDLIKPEALPASEENYEKEGPKSYANKRPLFVVLLRILASKINMMHAEEQGNTLDIFMTIYERIPDPELKIEVINILKCLFIGVKAFPNEEIPERYATIPLIEYEEKKVFYLLFEDNSKFNSHFEKRKMKPSDPTYSLNEMLYEQITAKVYFDFLCLYILNLKRITPDYLEKIRIFILYAIKIASPQLVDRIFVVLDEKYFFRNKQGFFLALFEDYKDLNCAEEYLQGDEIMLFFTIYLYKKILPQCSVSMSTYGVITEQEKAEKFENFYLKLLKSDLNSKNHLNMIKNIFKVGIELWGNSNPPLPMIIKEYLLTGSYNDQWGSILLQISLDYDSLTNEELVAINSSIIDWGTVTKYCENSKKESCKMFMDYVCRIYGDRDLINGYRINITRSPYLQEAMCNLQQRRYIETLKCIENHKKQGFKRERPHNLQMDAILDGPDLNLNDLIEENIFGEERKSNLLSFEEQTDEVYMNDIIRECYKNLNKWDDLLQKNKTDMETKIDYLFHCGGNRSKLSQILREVQNTGLLQQFGFYYGKSIQHFLESSNNSPNKDLNVALLYSLVEWLCFPKNARHQQNGMLVKIECLLELEEGEKIKDESNNNVSEHKEYLETLAKVVQSIYTQINYWRERMPSKNEDLTVWNAVLGQRNMLYEHIKKKIVSLYDSVISTSSTNNNNLQNSSTGAKADKLLVPYTDIEWNKLKLQKQHRSYGVFIKDDTNNSQLYLDEVYLRDKERFYEQFIHKKDMVGALKILEEQPNCKDEQQEKILKAEMMRMKAKVYIEKENFDHANQIFVEALDPQVMGMCSLWRDWMVMSCQAYEKTEKKEWAYTVISTLPFSLRHKTHKTKLLLAPVFKILKNFENDSKMRDILQSIIDNHQLPMKALLHWFPQIFKLAIGNSMVSNQMVDLLERLSDHSFSTIFFLIKPFLFKSTDPRAQVARNLILKGMKNINYHLTAKLQRFSQLLATIRDEDKISVLTLGQFCQCFMKIPLPLVEVESSKATTPAWIVQVSEELGNEVMNNKKGKIITFLGSNGKQYQYRLETVGKKDTDREYQNLLTSQLLETFNGYLELNKEAINRNLHIYELKRILLREDLIIMKNNKHSVTLLDVLNNYMNKQTFGSDYPESDRTFFRLPKSEINKTVNKRMKEIVPQNVLRNYLIDKAETYDQYISFRKAFGYQYGAICAVNYTMGIEANLGTYQFDMRSGLFSLNQFKVNHSNHKASPFSVRLSRNISNFLTPTHINASILPAMAATISSICTPKLRFKDYIEYLYSDLPNTSGTRPEIFKRVSGLENNFTKQRKILEMACEIAEENNIPYEYKYWF